MDFVIDEIDRKILRILTENSRTPYLEIAKQLGISEGTVRKRVKDMVRHRIIKKFTIEAEEGGIGAITLVKVDTKKQAILVAEEINRTLSLGSAHVITGEWDIATILRASDTSDLHAKIDAIREIKGVSSTSTLIMLS